MNDNGSTETCSAGDIRRLEAIGPNSLCTDVVFETGIGLINTIQKIWLEASRESGSILFVV